MMLLAQTGFNPPQFPMTPKAWILGAAVFILMLILSFLLVSLGLRRYLGSKGEQKDEFAPKTPSSNDSAAFMTASMQSVIGRLRDQERELARLHQAEKERAQQTERLSEAVTRNMPAGLLLINSSHLITYANPAAMHILGVQTLQYRRFAEALGPDAPLANLIHACLADGKTFQREQVHHSPPEGAERCLGVTISPVYETRGVQQGRISGALCLLSDLTELTALQKQVQLKESLANLGELAAGIAHEFKNSLATISGYAQMLRRDALTPDAKESVDKIIHETQSLTHIVTEFLRFARPLDLHSAPVNTQALVERVAQEVRDSFPGVRIETAGQFADVSGDEMLLRQALQNLLRNAAEACADVATGGKIRLFGSQERVGGRPWQQIAITDNGPGIPPSEQEKIFLPFHTTKSGGTGLGLAVVQKIIVHHGGVVVGRNSEGGGAEFLVTLPIREETGQAVELGRARI
jgi:signal transduction histidine kinase